MQLTQEWSETWSRQVTNTESELFREVGDILSPVVKLLKLHIFSFIESGCLGRRGRYNVENLVAFSALKSHIRQLDFYMSLCGASTHCFLLSLSAPEVINSEPLSTAADMWWAFCTYCPFTQYILQWIVHFHIYERNCHNSWFHTHALGISKHFRTIVSTSWLLFPYIKEGKFFC